MAYKCKLFVASMDDEDAVVVVTSHSLQGNQEGREFLAPLALFPRRPEIGDIFRGYLNEKNYGWEGIYEY